MTGQHQQQLLVVAVCLQVTFTPDLGAPQEYFLGAGGVFNLYTALTGETLPGQLQAVTQVGLAATAVQQYSCLQLRRGQPECCAAIA